MTSIGGSCHTKDSFSLGYGYEEVSSHCCNPNNFEPVTIQGLTRSHNVDYKKLLGELYDQMMPSVKSINRIEKRRKAYQ